MMVLAVASCVLWAAAMRGFVRPLRVYWDQRTLADDRRRAKESKMFGFDRITANHEILGGKASIRGMRISVALVVNLVANGMTNEEIIAEYPDLEAEDIRQALRYAAWVAADDLYTPLAAAA